MRFEPLFEEYREGVLECVHYGALVAVNRHGEIIFQKGEADWTCFYRSASKPIQALPVIQHGLDARYGLTHEETVLLAGSHAGEACHVAALESIFKKTELREDMLVMKPAVPAYAPANEERVRQGLPPRSCDRICAGKHAALML